MQCRRIPDDGFLLLALAPYHEIGVDRARAELKSRFMAEFAAAIIRNRLSQASRQAARAQGCHLLAVAARWRYLMATGSLNTCRYTALNRKECRNASEHLCCRR